jgi:hypothetical protein
MRPRRWLRAVSPGWWAAVWLLAACGGGGDGPDKAIPGPGPNDGNGGGGGFSPFPGSGGSGGTGTPNPDPGGMGNIRTVFLIMMENKAWSDIERNPHAPFINRTLLPNAALARNYKGPHDGWLHPGLPNYIWLEAGDTLGLEDDALPAQAHQATTNHLVTQLEAKQVSWKSYQEDIDGSVCPLGPHEQYAPSHNPVVFFDDVTDNLSRSSDHCISHVRPLAELETDLSNGTVAHYNFIAPNECNNMTEGDGCAQTSDAAVQAGDAWLARWIPRIQQSPVYGEHAVIFILWDEAEPSWNCGFGDCRIGLIALSALIKSNHYQNQVPYDHSSMVKTIQNIFGLTPLLRHAADDSTSDLHDLFSQFP